MRHACGCAWPVVSVVAQRGWLRRRSVVRKATLALRVAACNLGGARRASALRLTLHDQEPAPYSTSPADGSVSGLTATPAARALHLAGLSCSWVRTLSQRRLALIQEDEGPHCGAGWSRNPERSALGNFSKALYRDRPVGALMRNDGLLRPGTSGDEALVLRRDAGASGAGRRGVTSADMPAGELRHRYRNRTVPDAGLARLDQALAAPTP
jgi:hypothetical protein